MLDSDSSTGSIDYEEVYSLFTQDDLEDVLIKTAKQTMTVKEECEAISKLKSENFDLKWRLYLLNKDYENLLKSGGIGGQSSENGSIKNLNKKESLKDREIRMLRAVLEKRVQQLSSLKTYYDEIIKTKDIELEDLKMEKTSDYVTELECNTAALYEIIETKDHEMIGLKERLENQKNEIKKFKNDLKLTTDLANQSIQQTTQQTENQATDQTTINTMRLSLEQTRKELDQVKIELKNHRIMERDKLDNYARLMKQKEVEIDLLSEQIQSLKERENYLLKKTEQIQKENEQLQDNEEQLIVELNKFKFNEDQLMKDDEEFEEKIKNDYLIKKKQHLLKERNQQTEFDSTERSKNQPRTVDENSNLIKNSIDVQDLLSYTKTLEEKVNLQNQILQKKEIEKEQLIVQLNTARDKKKNLESIISKQLAATNSLLATAKQNLSDK